MSSTLKFVVCLMLGTSIACAGAREAHRRQVQGDQARAQVQAIFARCVEAQPETRGVFVVRVELKPDGKPASMKLENDSASHSLGGLSLQHAANTSGSGSGAAGIDPAFERCMAKDVMPMKFPPPGADPVVKIVVHTHGEVKVVKISGDRPTPTN